MIRLPFLSFRRRPKYGRAKPAYSIRHSPISVVYDLHSSAKGGGRAPVPTPHAKTDCGKIGRWKDLKIGNDSPFPLHVDRRGRFGASVSKRAHSSRRRIQRIGWPQLIRGSSWVR